jgi:KipI family sensor histidine kinase inhibitor
VNIRPYGWDALLLEVEQPLRWASELANRRAAGQLSCDEIVPGARTVLLRGVDEPDRVARELAGWQPGGETERAAAGPQVVIDVEWTGADLAEVGRAWRADPIEVLRETEFVVAFCGFAPGFGYLTGLPEHRQLPRLATPRTRVPAGSVALAGPYAGIYPHSSPGGWLLVGRTDAVLFDLDSDPPALLTPGTQVRFR